MIERHELAEQLADVARELLGAGELDATLQRIVELAVATIEGCDHAGISLVVDRHLETPAQNDHVPQVIDELQNAVGQGPCWDAIREHAVFETGDLSAESRWPRFSTEVVASTGVHSAMSIRLQDDHGTLGALNLYARAKDAFDDQDRGVAPIFAAHAAIALRAAQHHRHLIAAIETRDIIGQAKGIIMAREGVDDTVAFEILRDGSNRLRCKLRDLANQIVDHQRQR
jgi:GAF domain-containing protein